MVVRFSCWRVGKFLDEERFFAASPSCIYETARVRRTVIESVCACVCTCVHARGRGGLYLKFIRRMASSARSK